MEEYLRNMRSLRTQINDFEEEAASTSAEEEKQRTAIAAMKKDLESVRSGTKELIQEADEFTRRSDQVRCQIAEKQRKISSLEIESSTLSQTLELLHKEFEMLQEKLNEERSYYQKVSRDLNSKLQDQKDWINSQKLHQTENASSVEGINGKPMEFSKGILYGDPASGEKMTRATVDELEAKISEISLDNIKLKQLIAQYQLKIDGFPSEIKAAELKLLEEEHQALLTDKGGELEYLQSLQERTGLLKAISEEVKCQCGQMYTVSLGDFTPQILLGSG